MSAVMLGGSLVKNASECEHTAGSGSGTDFGRQCAADGALYCPRSRERKEHHQIRYQRNPTCQVSIYFHFRIIILLQFYVILFMFICMIDIFSNV